MSGARPALFWVLLLSVAESVIGLNACGGGGAAQPSDVADFKVTATALSPATVTQGKSSTASVTITAFNGFVASVALSCTGLPSGATCSFNPASIANGSGSSQLTVSTSTASPPGGYSVAVMATSAATVHKAPLTLGVQSIIQHVVIIFQENRTPDNLFHGLPGADIADSGTDSHGNVITLTPEATGLVAPYDLSHSHLAFLDMYDGGKMDGADKIPSACEKNNPGCKIPPHPSFQYVDPSVVQPYFTMAETYTFGDRMFQTNQGPSFPAHQFIISGNSVPNTTSNSFVAENPGGTVDALTDTGCTAPLAELVPLIDASTGDESQAIYPCFEHPTITDLLNAQSLSWKYYAPSSGSIWTAPNAIRHMCVPDPSGLTCTGSDWTNNVVLASAQNPDPVLTDIANGKLAAVTWVIPDGDESDHSGITMTGAGPSWVASIVNAIGASPFWSNTAIIITWDDWGGWYDHAAPPSVLNAYEFGFRVPLIVVSPYAKPAFVSHTFYDFGSILKFVEATFALPTVAPGAMLTYADEFSGPGDLSDCFDFNQAPVPFQAIPASLDARYFLNNHTPRTDPDDD